MTARDAPIPRKKKVEIQAEKPKKYKDTEVTEEKERTYSIDRLNLGDPSVESKNDSE